MTYNARHLLLDAARIGPMKKTTFLLCLCLLLLSAASCADERHDEDIVVQVQIEGENVSADVNMPVDASREQVWVVLTDFAHMASFVANVRESKIISSQGDVLMISQRGTAKYGPLSFPFESTREIRLTPWERIQSRLVSGNMRKMTGLTLLSDLGAGTRVVYHTDSIPGVWIPPLVGKTFIAHEMREQFQQMRDEIMRRKRAQTK
jgi:hypothetical protein